MVKSIATKETRCSTYSIKQINDIKTTPFFLLCKSYVSPIIL